MQDSGAKQEVSVLLVQDYQINWDSKVKFQTRRNLRSESKNLCTNFPKLLTDFTLCMHRDPINLQKIVAKMPIN